MHICHGVSTLYNLYIMALIISEHALTVCSRLLQDLLQSCMEEIEEMIREFAQEQVNRGASGATSSDRAVKHSKAETPTDVCKVHF